MYNPESKKLSDQRHFPVPEIAMTVYLAGEAVLGYSGQLGEFLLGDLFFYQDPLQAIALCSGRHVSPPLLFPPVNVNR